MAPYTYSGYYDPVGSQTTQPQGYTYQNSTTPASAYPSSNTANQYASSTYQQYGNNVYESQHRGADGQRAGSSTDRAATSLSSLGGHDFSHGASNRSTSNTGRYENTQTWNNPSYTTSAYNSNTGLTQTTRTQSSTSPVYGSSVLPNPLAGRASNSQLPEPSQARNTGYNHANNSASNYSTTNYAPQNHMTQQPQRFSSPLHAQQAQQQGHKQAPSTGPGRLTSPQLVQQNAQQRNRQQSSSTEATDTTVNPAAVYDNRAELQRKAQLEAERRRKQQEAEAARKVKEERVKAAQQAEEERLKQQEHREETARLAAEAAERKKEENARKAEQRKKKREEKLQSKNAASALQQLATSACGGGDEEAPPANDEEAEMRAMFKRMREFNQRNPTMLAKLWEEERKAHSGAQAQPRPKQTGEASQPAKSVSPAQSQHQPVEQATPTEQPQSQAGQQIRPFKRAPEPSTAQRAPPPKPQQAIWPPGQKGHLAEAAAHWLNSQPLNIGKMVSKAEILKLLDENPPYVTLCESLEAKGMRFERAAFAKELLRAAPDSMKAQASIKPTAPLSTTSSTAPQVNGSSQFSKGKEVARNKSAMVDYETPSFSSVSNTSDRVHRISSQQSLPVDARSGAHAREPIQSYQSPYFAQPPLQQHMSQLATHEDLQPVTSNEINGASFQATAPEQKPKAEPIPPPNPPADKEEAARKRTFGDLVDLTGGDSDDEGPPPKLKITDALMPQARNSTPQPTSSNQIQAGTHLLPAWASRSGLGQPTRPASTSPAFMSKPMTMYVGPSTPQPTSGQAPIAPMQTPAPPKPKGPSQEQLQQQRVKGKMLVEPIMRDRVARRSTYDSRTIARDVLLATGRHPDMRPLNGHLATMQRLLGEHGGQLDVGDAKGNRSDLATIRWDIIDPGTPMSGPRLRGPEGYTRTPFGTLALRANSPGDIAGAVSAEPERGQSRAAAQYVAGKKIGRPAKHGSEKRQQRANGADRGKPASASDSRSPKPHASARPATPSTANQQGGRGTPMSSEGAVGYAAFRQVDEDGNPIKRKGRPPGWRKHIHSREAHGLAPVKSGTSSNPASAKKPQPLAEPVYQVFECAWQDCNAKLHNLDALKKHLVKNHGKANDYGTFDCLWSDCGEPASQDLAEWIGHVDREHLQPVAWKLGDGPKAGLAGE